MNEGIAVMDGLSGNVNPKPGGPARSNGALQHESRRAAFFDDHQVVAKGSVKGATTQFAKGSVKREKSGVSRWL